MNSKKSILPWNAEGWHFAGATLCDGTPLPARGWISPKVQHPTMYYSGWHYCPRIMEALMYATGYMVARRRPLSPPLTDDRDSVRCAEQIEQTTDYVNSRNILEKFARYCAWRALQNSADVMGRAGLIKHADTLAAIREDDATSEDTIELTINAAIAAYASKSTRSSSAVPRAAGYASMAAKAVSDTLRSGKNAVYIPNDVCRQVRHTMTYAAVAACTASHETSYADECGRLNALLEQELSAAMAAPAAVAAQDHDP
jgi:hypothetical protein